MPAWPIRIVLSLLLVQQPPPAPSAPAPQAPAGETPSAEAPAGADPARAEFSTEVGLLLVLVKADRTADYEAAMQALQDALASSTDPARAQVARGWRVYRAAEADAKGNAVYVHALTPAVPGVDYRPSLLLDELLADAPADLLTRYTESLAAPPTRLSLTEVAHMAVAPVRK